MDQEQFDSLARSIAAGVSRRRAFGLATGAIGLAFGVTETEAAKRHGRRRKKRRRKNRHGSGSNNGQCKSAGSRTCDVSEAKPGAALSQCNFAQAGLVGVSLQSATLEKANLSGAHLLASDLAGANLKQACLAGASLRNADLRGANVSKASFVNADLCGADFRSSNVTPAQIAAAETCCGTLLSDGASAAPCRSGTTCCGTGCVPLDTDPYNCGACGYSCASGEICCNGQCGAPSSSGDCSVADVQCLKPEDDLQAAIRSARPGDVITLCQGTWKIQDTLLIDVDLQITGGFDGGTSEIDAGLNCQVFGIRKNVRVTMSNITIQGGRNGNGAGIFNQGYLTLGDCNINGNDALQYGGGIYNEGSLRIVRGFVQKNTAYNEDFGYGGLGLFNDEGVITIEGASISNNKTFRTFNAGRGGGIYNYYGAVLLGPNSLVTGNELHGSGGGLYNEGGNNEIAASNIIVDNHPDNCAGNSTFDNCNG